MANSTITFTFNSIPSADTFLSFGAVITTGLPFVFSETFKAIRTAVGEAKIGSTIDETILNYKNALELDFNNISIFTVTPDYVNDKIIIVVNSPERHFELYTNTTSGAVSVEIVNNALPAFTITSLIASEATTSPCSNVKISVTTSEQADEIVHPINQTVSTNPFVFNVARTNATMFLRMHKDIRRASIYYQVPILSESLFDIDVVNTPSEAVLTVNSSVINSPNLLISFEYSLDNVTYYDIGSSIIGISPGDYTLYIRDNIGCSITIPLTVDEFTPNLIDYSAILEVSNVNSIRFKKDAVWSNCGTLKTINNTLSFEERDRRVVNNFVQLFQKCDTIKTQIKSNYTTNEAFLIDENGDETELIVVKKTDNMNKTDVRDAKVFEITTSSYLGRLGIRFDSGQTYDPDTLVTNGTYNLGNNIPAWMNIGDYISIQGQGWFLIEDIVTDVIGKFLVLNTNWSLYGYLENDTVITSSVYNVLDFERYEFTIPFSTLEGYYKVRLNFEDSVFENTSFTSEWLSVKEEHCNTFLIDYYNTENNEINYSTGIRHRLRIPYVFNLKWKPSDEQDIYVTDTNTVLLESKVREFYDFTIKPLPTAMAQKIVLALAHDRLFINGESFLKEGEVSSKSFGDSNTYQVTATLVRSNYVFDSNSGIGYGEVLLPSGSPLSIDENASGLLFVD